MCARPASRRRTSRWDERNNRLVAAAVRRWRRKTTFFGGAGRRISFLLEERSGWAKLSSASLIAPRIMPHPTHPVIAIDGTAASGKSTFSRRLAQRLGFYRLCQHRLAMYRGVTWYLQDKNIPLRDAGRVSPAKSRRPACETRLENGELVFLVAGVDPLPHVREAKVNAEVSLRRAGRSRLRAACRANSRSLAAQVPAGHGRTRHRHRCLPANALQILPRRRSRSPRSTPQRPRRRRRDPTSRRARPAAPELPAHLRARRPAPRFRSRHGRERTGSKPP